MREVILVCNPVPRAALEAARAEFPQFEWREGAPNDAEAVCSASIIFGKPDIELLEHANLLRWQQNPSAGVEKWASCAAFLKGIFQLTTAAGMHESCAQHAFALLLALSRRIHLYERTLHPGGWKSTRPEDAPLVLSGQTLGVLGLGAIGRRLCVLGRAFGMKTIGVNRSGVRVEEADETFPISKVDEVLPRCDALILILPATCETDNLINVQRLSLVRKHCLLVNVGRGNCIDEAALIAALKRGTPAAAALDVFKREPLPADSEFYRLPNVLVSPHIGGDRPDYEARAFDVFLENLRRYVRGEKLKNLVQRDRGY